MARFRPIRDSLDAPATVPLFAPRKPAKPRGALEATPAHPLPTTERDVQRAIVKLYRQLGAQVYPTSTNRRSGVSVGMPDLYVCPRQKRAFWVECKAPKGKASPEQEAFVEASTRSGVPVFVCRSLEEGRAAWESLQTA